MLRPHSGGRKRLSEGGGGGGGGGGREGVFPGYVPEKELKRSSTAAEALPGKSRDISNRVLRRTQVLFQHWILRSRQRPINTIVKASNDDDSSRRQPSLIQSCRERKAIFYHQNLIPYFSLGQK